MSDSNIIATASNVSYVLAKPNYNISFHGEGGKEIGKLDFNGPALVFTGNAEESAKVFADYLAKSFYGRIEEAAQAERERCAQICDAQIAIYETKKEQASAADLDERWERMENYRDAVDNIAAAIRAQGKA